MQTLCSTSSKYQCCEHVIARLLLIPHTRAGLKDAFLKYIQEQPAVQRASTCCTHKFGWVLHNPYAHDATHSSYSRSYFCPHALFLSHSLCVYARAHRTSFCPWLDAEGCLLLCQINHQTLVAGPNPPDSPAILPVEAYCSKLPLQAHRCLGCVSL